MLLLLLSLLVVLGMRLRLRQLVLLLLLVMLSLILVLHRRHHWVLIKHCAWQRIWIVSLRVTLLIRRWSWFCLVMIISGWWRIHSIWR